MDFKIYLTEQLRKHPSIQPLDVIKMCYQAAYGAEHLLSDPNRARSYLKREYDEVTAADGELYEQISDKVCRVNLSVWKMKGMPVEWLFRMFAVSCKVEENAEELFEKYLQDSEVIVASGEVGFTAAEWAECLSKYKVSGMTAVHHSEEYRKCERPAYRIVNCRFLKTLAALEKANYAQDDFAVPPELCSEERLNNGTEQTKRIPKNEEKTHKEKVYE